MAQGLALHIGLNSVDPVHYQGWSGDLLACEADARDMSNISKSKGFDAKLLLTKEATRDAVLAQVSEAAKILSSGDIFILTYSGHGGQIPDLDGDEKEDGLDETWCLFDGELVDDEIYLLLSEFEAGVRILSFSDSCHSGSVLKNALMARHFVSPYSVGVLSWPEDTRYRAMPNPIASSTYLAHADFYNEILRSKDMKGVKAKVQAAAILISGCQDNQLSADGPFNGRFTGVIKSVWNGGQFAGDYKKFHAMVKTRMPPDQTPNYFTLGQGVDNFAAENPFTI